MKNKIIHFLYEQRNEQDSLTRELSEAHSLCMKRDVCDLMIVFRVYRRGNGFTLNNFNRMLSLRYVTL